MIYSLENKHELQKVFLNDVDVTHDTFYIDTQKGFINKYKRDNKGHYFIENDEVAWETLKGNIRIELKDGIISFDDKEISIESNDGTILEVKKEKKKKGSVVDELNTDTVRQD